MIASRSIAQGLYHFCLLHDLLQKRRNFSADHARDMVSRNFGPVLFARGIAASTCDDLTPFLADGTVTANLPRLGKHGQNRDRPMDGTSWIDLRRDLALRALWQDSAA